MHKPWGSLHFQLYNICNILLASESVIIHDIKPILWNNFNFNKFQGIFEQYIWHVKPSSRYALHLIMTCLSWWTFTNLLHCTILNYTMYVTYIVASWHEFNHDVKPVLCHNFIHIEAYLFDDLKNDEKPSRCLNLHLIKTCLSWCTIANQPSLRGITCPLLFREMVCPTTLNVVDRQ